MKPYTCSLLLLLILGSCKKAVIDKDKLPDVALVAWGDSLTEGAGGGGTTYLSILSGLTSIKATFNEGIRKQNSTEIRDRMVKDTLLHRYPTIIWAGRNNFKDSVTVKKDIAQMVNSLGHQHYVVLGIINSNYYNEHKGYPNYNRIVSLNKQLAAIYGTHFIDIRTYLVSKYDPADSVDVKDHEADITPTSLRADSLHMNSEGYYFVAKKIYSNINQLVN